MIRRTEERPLKADPFAQLKLLDLQELDSRATTLRHQKAHLPEAAEIAELEARLRQVDGRMRDARISRDDLAGVQAKAEADVEAVRARRQRDQQRIDDGSIADPKDIVRMQSELANLDRRIGVLEDEELEVMEQLETAQQTVTELEAQVAELGEKIAVLAAKRDERVLEIDAQLAEALAERGPAAEGLPEELLALYDKLRDQKGTGAAELRARRCSGCMLTLDSAEITRLKSVPSNEVVRCEECGRILVRTAESGL